MSLSEKLHSSLPTPELTDRGVILRAFERALALEAHVLQRRPDLVWSQLYNRLQWEPDPVPSSLAGALAARTGPGAAPWIHSRTKPRESSALVRTFGGHVGSVEACALALGDTALVTAGNDGTLRIWDVTTGMMRVMCRGHQGPVHDCAISEETGLVASAGEDATVRLWRMDNGQPVATLEGHRGAVNACAMSPAGDYVVSAGEDRTVRVWNTRSKERRHRFYADGPLYACAVSPDGRLIAAAGKESTAHLWDASEGRAHPTLPGTFEARTCRFTPDGRSLLIAGSRNDVTVVNLATGEHRSGFYANTKEHHRFYWGVGRGGPEGMALSPDGRRLLTAAPDNTLRFWEFPDGGSADTLVGHADVIRCVAFGTQGTLAVSGGRDGTARLWDLRRIDAAASVVHADPVSDCAFDLDGDVLVAMWGDRTAAVLDPDTLREIRRLGGGNVHACAVSPDGRFVATTFMGVQINVHDLQTRTIALSFKEKGADPSTAWIHACVFDHTGRFLISANEEGTLSVWNLGTKEKVITLEGHRAAVTDCTMVPSSNLLVSSSRDRSLIVWNLEGLRRHRTIAAHAPLVACAVGPDGRTIVAGGEDGSVSAWDAADGRRRWTRQAHEGEASACAVSPDGALVFSVGSDKTVAVWDCATGDARARVVMPGELSCLAVHPARPELVCGDSGGGLYNLELEGLPYRAVAPASRRREAAAPSHYIPAHIKPRVDAPADLLTALQLLIVAVPATQAIIGGSASLLGTASADKVLLAAIALVWILMTRIGLKERRAVPRCDGELALLTIIAAGAAVLPPQLPVRGFSMAAGIGIIAGVIDVAAGQYRAAVALKIPMGWALLMSVPAGFAAGIRAAAAAGDDRVAAAVVGWLAGLVGGATLMIAALVAVARIRSGIRAALMASSNRPRIALGAAVVALAIWTGPALLAAPPLAWALVRLSRPAVRWTPGASRVTLLALLAAAFALLAWPVGSPR